MAHSVFPFMRLTAAALFAVLAAGGSVPALAQQSPLVQPDGSRAVVQALPPQATADLDAALKRLAADPRDVAALLAAGNASLELNSADAATGFFTRAKGLGSAEGDAGLAAVQVYRKKPVEALQLFDAAQGAGASRLAHASDHGLAYDLVGDNAHAQEFYRLALQQKPDDDETTRRLALSEAIGGDQAAADRTLLPMLQHRDLAAYRTRAFALAALGKTDEAVSIAEVIMPASLASRITPYLRYMPKLTRAQQAAAANFGHFPAADAIGHDDPRIAAYSAGARTVSVASTVGDQRLVPTGAPLGSAIKPAPPPARTVVAEAKPVQRAPAPAFQRPAGPPPSATNFASKAATAPAVTPTATQVAAVQPSRAPATVAASAATGPAPTGGRFDLGGVSGSKTGAIEVAQVAGGELAEAQPAAPAAVPESGPEPPIEPPSLDEAFAEFEKVTTAAGPAPGAVDVTAIKQQREAALTKPALVKPAPAKPAKPAKPKDPSRIWVQVATGGNRKALGTDWQRITKKAAKEFKGKSGYLVDWGRTNRLVTGPFASEDKAQDFIGALKKAGVNTFMFTSDEGEKVVPLGGK